MKRENPEILPITPQAIGGEVSQAFQEGYIDDAEATEDFLRDLLSLWKDFCHNYTSYKKHGVDVYPYRAEITNGQHKWVLKNFIKYLKEVGGDEEIRFLERNRVYICLLVKSMAFRTKVKALMKEIVGVIDFDETWTPNEVLGAGDKFAQSWYGLRHRIEKDNPGWEISMDTFFSWMMSGRFLDLYPYNKEETRGQGPRKK